MSALYTIGQMNQLADALEAAGYSPEDVTKLRKVESLTKFKSVLAGLAVIVPNKHIIDCDADPFIPDGWKVEEHKKGGQLEWDASKVALFLAEEQKNGSIEGYKLREQLAGKPGMNANVLGYLLANPHIIPDEWKGMVVFFWGTIYRGSDDRLCVRCLGWDGDGWFWYCDWLDDGWGSGSPALVLRKLSPLGLPS